MTAVFPVRLPVCLLFSPSLWTPPIPPVTNTGMPARCAAIIVADTVVPPESPWKNTVQDSIQTLPQMTCSVCNVCQRVSLCWGRRADHDGTPSGSSCSGQGGRAPLTTGRHGLHPLSLPPWLEWLLRLSQWPPPPLLCCIKTLTVLNASKNKKIKRLLTLGGYTQGTSGCVDRACHVWWWCSPVRPLVCFLPAPVIPVDELWRGRLGEEIMVYKSSILSPICELWVHCTFKCYKIWWGCIYHFCTIYSDKL